jgi:mono/diheme cytochrome c family protein
MKNQLPASLLAVALVGATCADSLAQSDKAPPAPKKADGQKLFASNCASCHPGGGNVVKPKQPVAGSPRLAALATFKAFLENPTGHMPYAKHIVIDKELLQALYEYCKTLKPAKQAANPSPIAVVAHRAG